MSSITQALQFYVQYSTQNLIIYYKPYPPPKKTVTEEAGGPGPGSWRAAIDFSVSR